MNFPDRLEKYSNIKFHENPSNGSRVVPCGSTDTTKVIVSFRSFSNGPETHQMELKNNLKFWLLLTNVYSTNIRVNKSRKMTWPGHVVRTGKKRGAYRIVGGGPEGKRPPGIPRHRWEDNIKLHFQEVGRGMDWIDLAKDRCR